MPPGRGANARRLGNAKFNAPKVKKAKRQPRPPPAPRQKMTDEQVEKLRELFRKQFGGKEPRQFQIDAIRAQQDGRDVLVHVATGMGKTVVAGGPFLLEENADKVMLLISPLVGLQEEMVDTFKDEFGVRAVALNSAHEITDEQLRDVIDGRYRIVLLSPEMLLSHRFLDRVLRNRVFSNKIYSVVVDEAHCISHWGADFRKKYAQIGSIRVFLPRDTPFVALSASLTDRVTRDVVEKLQLNRANYLHIDLGNDRPNVSLVARAIQNPLNSYTDLDFVIPSSPTSINDIPTTWIYADSIPAGTEIITHLRKLLPDITMHGTIRPFNAVHGTKYRKKVMRRFKKGKVRILVCTDAAGMGCNVPDIDVVVQWKLPKKLSSFVQRAGRAARGAGRVGLAVLLVEPSAYSRSILEEAIAAAAKSKAKKRKKKGEGGTEKKAADKKKKKQDTWPADHGRFRGGRSGRDDFPKTDEKFPPLNHSHEGEGIFHFVQTRGCRREVLAEVYNNPKPSPTVPCCDVCNPELLDRTRPGMKPKRGGDGRVTYAKESSKAIWIHLDDWREAAFERDFAWSSMTPETVLPTAIMDKLARLELPLREQHVKKILSSEWARWPRYGEALVAQLLTTTIALNPVTPAASNLSSSDPSASPPPTTIAADVNPAPLTATPASHKRHASTGIPASETIQTSSRPANKKRKTVPEDDDNHDMTPHADEQRLEAQPVTPSASLNAPTTTHVNHTSSTVYPAPSHASSSLIPIQNAYAYGPYYSQQVHYTPQATGAHPGTYVQQGTYAQQAAYAQQQAYEQQAFAQRQAYAQWFAYQQQQSLPPPQTPVQSSAPAPPAAPSRPGPVPQQSHEYMSYPPGAYGTNDRPSG